MTIYLGIDGVICETLDERYEFATPYRSRIERVNNLHKEGHEIVYWTSRGTDSGRDLWDMTKRQLDDWGVKYSKLMVGKPKYDLFIDDKSINKIDEKLTEWLTEKEK